MSILLTGFGRFGGLGVNPSQIVVQKMGKQAKPDVRENLKAEILPTEFSLAGERIRELIRRVRPSVVVALGVSASLDAITLERVALNLDDCDEPDNAGEKPEGRIIVPDGPTAYWSTLPLGRLRNVLKDRNIPSAISNHAGTFVCNHVFYLARHEIEQLKIGALCGFIHLPLMPEQVKASTMGVPGMPLAMMCRAVECCLDAIWQNTNEDSELLTTRI